MNTYCTIYKGDGKTLRFISSDYGYCEHFQQWFHHAESCYYDYEQLKTYRLKTQ